MIDTSLITQAQQTITWDTFVADYADDGWCTGYGYNKCYGNKFEVCGLRHDAGGSQYGSHNDYYISYRCCTCGEEVETIFLNSADNRVPTYVQAAGLGSSFRTYHNSTHSDCSSRKITGDLCTENLQEEVHTVDDFVGTYSAATCSKCGYNAGTYYFSHCKKCGATFPNSGVTHCQGSQTSTGGGYVRGASPKEHTVLKISHCNTHNSDKIHWVYGYQTIPIEEYSDKYSGTLAQLTKTKNISAHYCTRCYSYVTGKHVSQYYSPQTTQTITATLNPTSVGYGCTCPTLTVNGAQTSLTYASSDSNTATISSTGVISLVGVGTTKFTITAAETSSWTSATATATLTVTKGDLKVKTVPTASSISYGQSLTSSSLTGGSVTNGSGVAVGGSFAWKSPGTIPDSGGSKVYVVRFTPTEVSKYNY